MSGGAFDYLYGHEAEVVLLRDEETIREAASALSYEGAADIGADLLDFLAYAKSVQDELNTRWRKFSPVLRALEWDYSGDTLDGLVDKAAEYRARKQP